MAGPRQSSAAPAATSAVDLDGARVLVVEARFYDTLADELLEGARAVLDKAGCRVDVVTARLAHGGDDARVLQQAAKRHHPVAGRAGQA
mgnify:CR=1 FL=1